MTVDRAFLCGLAGLFAAVLCVTSSILREHRIPEFGRVAACFIAGPGVVTACWLIRQGLMPTEPVRLLLDVDESRLFLVLGGLAAGWVSVATIAKECQAAASKT
jgi:hypothetical protein